MKVRFRTLCGWVVALGLVGGAAAERYPVRVFTVADGLAANSVTELLVDREGWLWVGTADGLTRFDGATFFSYQVADGLPHPVVSALAEDGAGTLWVGTPRGLVRLRRAPTESGRPLEPAATEDRGPRGIEDLAVDAGGDLWVASASGLWTVKAAEGGGPRRVPLDGAEAVRDLAVTADGSVWAGAGRAVYRVRRGKPPRRIQMTWRGLPTTVRVLGADGAGRLWLGLVELERILLLPAGEEVPPMLQVERLGVTRGKAGARGGAAALLLERAMGVPALWTTGLAARPDGSLALSNYRSGLYLVGDGEAQRLSLPDGLPDQQLNCVLADRWGRLWLGTANSGLALVDPSRFTSYTRADGLATEATAAVMSGPAGEVLVDGFPPGRVIHRLSRRRFESVTLPIPGEATELSWGLGQTTLASRSGDWWVPTSQGLYRFARPAAFRDLGAARAVRVYRAGDGLGGDHVFRLFEDSSGTIWAGVFGAHSVVRIDRNGQRVQGFGARDGLPEATATAFAEDASGAVWIGFYNGGIARYRDGAFELFGEAEGIPTGFVFALHVDGGGRLWAGTVGGGLGRLDRPEAAHPVWRRYTTTDGLTSDSVLALTSDGRGNLYLGGPKGVDRLEVASGRVTHLDSRDGLVADSVISACRDHRGDLWFATGKGVSRMRPAPAGGDEAPAARIVGLSVDGAAVAIPELGTAALGPLRLPAGTRSLSVRFTAVSLLHGRTLRFRAVLSGRPLELAGARSVELAGLAPGSYRLAVRPELADGRVGTAATLGFSIAPPFWRSWWFRLAVLLSAVLAVAGGHRARVRRLVELRQVRERIAADLHDELGLSLSRISILSDSLERSAAPDEAGDLRLIGETARELIDATSDMAWALDPGKDTVAALAARLRKAGGALMEGAGIRFAVRMQEGTGAVRLGPERRRHLLLLLKEALNNAVRHGRPSAVTLTVERREGELVIILEDDGRGFDPQEVHAGDGLGNGLPGMERRAREAGAGLELASSPGRGTRVVVRLPVARVT